MTPDLATLYAKHHAQVLRTCQRLTWHHPDDAEDLAQAVWLQVCRRLHQFRSECRFTTWLHTVILSQHKERVRRETRLMRRPPGGLTSLEAELAAGLAPTMTSGWDPTWVDLPRALGRLPAVPRALVLGRLDGLTEPELSARHGLKRNTVAGHLRRARQALREELNP